MSKCRICNEEREVDCCGYCGECYPYDIGYGDHHHLKQVKKDNEWANIAATENRRAGALHYNG